MSENAQVQLNALQQAMAARTTLPEARACATALASQGTLPIVDLFGFCALLSEQDRRDDAIALYRQWLESTSSGASYAVLFNLAIALGDAGDELGAIAAYRTSLELNPGFIEAHLNMGNLLERRGEPVEALKMWNRASELADRSTAAGRAFLIQSLNNMGRLLEIRKQLPEAEDMLTRSLALDPAQPQVLTHLVHLRQKQCKWPIFAPLEGVHPKALFMHTSALAMLSASDDPVEQLAAARRFVNEKVMPAASPALAPVEGYRHQRLRIGYLSSDLCAHAVSILTAELYELHDRSQFEVFAFSWSREDGTAMRKRVVSAMDHYIRIDGMNDEQAARLIRSYEIDILVDLHGLTAGTRPDILSWRPAPVQITYLGFPGPTGLPCIDYVVADPFVLPPEMAPYFTETPLYMPGSFQINDRQREIGPRPTRAACSLPEDAFVFCSFNNNYKFTEAVFASWMRILRRVPGSVLWLVSDHEEVRINLRAEAARQDIDPARLYFAERAAPPEYLARYQLADLFLDTFPFNAGTTGSDALWAGLPLLTYAGRTFASRMAGSLLHAVGLPELVTHSLQDYEDKAVSLASAPARVEEMKAHLRADTMHLPLFDTPAYVRAFEDKLKSIAKRSTGAPAEPEGPAIALYQIAYSDTSARSIQPGYLVLNNKDNARPDWREYWPIRNFLTRNELVEERLYGFFSPKFESKTGLTHQAVVDFVTAAGPDIDVVTFSPQADMGAFFLSVFEQNEVFDPGFMDASEAFFRHAGIKTELRSMIMDSRQTVFSNFFVAKPAFWRAWLRLNEIMFDACEGADTPLGRMLNAETTYDKVPRKVFLMERIASFLLASDTRWKVRAYSTFQCAWSGTGMNQYRFEAVCSDALKLAMREQGHADYMEAFVQMRDQVFRRNETK